MNLGRIYLVGMPGSGKSYLADQLAEKLAIPKLDLDDAIEEEAQLSISEIFATEGEAYFRALESKVLLQISESYSDVILATGGGTPCFHQGMDYMNSNGLTVFLDTDREVLIDRISENEDRPLMRGDIAKTVGELEAKRLPIYRQAKLTIAHRDCDLLISQIQNLKN